MLQGFNFAALSVAALGRFFLFLAKICLPYWKCQYHFFAKSLRGSHANTYAFCLGRSGCGNAQKAITLSKNIFPIRLTSLHGQVGIKFFNSNPIRAKTALV